MLRYSFFILLVASSVLLSACNQGPAKSHKPTAETLLITPEDIITLHTDAFTTGPTITGSIQPEKKADLRAEISSLVLSVLKENGEPVKKGDLLVRLDDTAIRDSLQSAQAAERVAAQSLAQAQRQLERLKTLRVSGMASMQSLEDAENKRNTAQSELAAAKTGLAQARQQLERTEIRAPFAGVVSERKVSNGDTAQIGKELIKVIDLSSMRFEGLVPADAISQVQIGQAVHFRINGYPGKIFKGVVKRINPQANPVTRQVEVLVDFTDSKQPQVSGLYAEGQIASSNTASLMIPEMAIAKSGDDVSAWVIKNNAIHKTKITLGTRDVRTGDYAVHTGLQNGAVILRYPTMTLVDGQKVETSNKSLQ